jgi:hypothetical protein
MSSKLLGLRRFFSFRCLPCCALCRFLLPDLLDVGLVGAPNVELCWLVLAILLVSFPRGQLNFAVLSSSFPSPEEDVGYAAKCKDE